MGTRFWGGREDVGRDGEEEDDDDDDVVIVVVEQGSYGGCCLRPASKNP